MQDIRLICIDIDGTLLDSCHQLPPENRAAVLWAEKQGAAICLMTARPPGATVSIQQALDIQGPIACFGGGLLEYQGKRLCDVRVPVQAAALLVQECAAKQIHLSIYRGSGWYIGCCDKWSAQESQITGLTPMCANLGNTIHTWGSSLYFTTIRTLHRWRQPISFTIQFILRNVWQLMRRRLIKCLP